MLGFTGNILSLRCVRDVCIVEASSPVTSHPRLQITHSSSMFPQRHGIPTMNALSLLLLPIDESASPTRLRVPLFIFALPVPIKVQENIGEAQ